jgi:hypothetical protein
VANQARLEQAWHCLVAACLVVGAVASLFVTEAGHSLWRVMVVSSVVLTVSVTLAYQPTAIPDAARNGTVAAAVATSLFGWLGLLGFAVPLVALLLVLLHPVSLRRWAELLDRGAPPGAAYAPFDQLTTTALVHTWKLSYRALTTTTDPDVRAQAAESRRRCLEELERRDPVGVRLWLAAGARADGDPGPFLRCGETPRW